MKPKVYITYRHLRRYNSVKGNYDKGGITICIKVDLRHNFRTLEFAFAFCNANAGDEFCKATGREISYKRLKDQREAGEQEIIKYNDTKSIVLNIMNEVRRKNPSNFPHTNAYLKKYIL